MKRKFRNMLFLAALSAVLSGCGQKVDESAYSQSKETSESVVMSVETRSTVTESEGEIVTDEKSVNGVILKKNSAEWLGKMQYYHGKIYVIDADDTVLGEPLPAVARKTGEGYTEPDISYFYFTEDELFYLEESKTVRSPYLDTRSFDLYVQSLETGQVKLLAENICAAAYDSGIIIYEEFKGYYGIEAAEEDTIIRQISASTGEILREVNLGNHVSIRDYGKDFIIYFPSVSGEDYYYYWDSGEKQEVVVSDDIKYNRSFCVHGNIYYIITEEDGTRKLTEIYEQGQPISRFFSVNLPEYFYFSNEKIFYQKDRKVLMYDLETDKEQFICEIGSDEYGEHRLCGAQESGGMILIMEDSIGPEGGYPIIYLYEVQDGEKTLVTNAFWTE